MGEGGCGAGGPLSNAVPRGCEGGALPLGSRPAAPKRAGNTHTADLWAAVPAPRAMSASCGGGHGTGGSWMTDRDASAGAGAAAGPPRGRRRRNGGQGGKRSARTLGAVGGPAAVVWFIIDPPPPHAAPLNGSGDVLGGQGVSLCSDFFLRECLGPWRAVDH